METKEKLESSLKDAMRAGDELRKRTLRMALAAVRFAEVEKGKALDEQAVLAIMQKEIKSRQESIADADRAHRPDLIETAQAEMEVLKAFLPQPFSPEELQELARQVIAEVGAASPADTGKVMKAIMPRIQGRATGDQVSQTVRQLLQ